MSYENEERIDGYKKAINHYLLHVTFWFLEALLSQSKLFSISASEVFYLFFKAMSHFGF